jgi:hypothetical protein
MLSPEEIQRYKQFYERRFGVGLSDEEASFRANNLFLLYMAVYGRRTSRKPASGMAPSMANTQNGLEGPELSAQWPIPGP